MNEIILWANTGRLAVEGSNPDCPNCSAKKIDFQYVGNPSSRLGYLVIWCSACNHGTQISRVKIPEHVDFLPDSSSSDQIAQRIPGYIPIDRDEIEKKL